MALLLGPAAAASAQTVSIVNSPSPLEGRSRSVVASLSSPVGSNVVLGWSTGDDDTEGANQATAGTDYPVVTDGSATIVAGQTEAYISVSTTQDSDVEGDETFKVTITGTTLPAGVTIGTASTVFTIRDDDNRVSVGAASATEGSALSFTVRLPLAVSSDVVLGWSTGDDDTSGANQATAGTDYTAVTSGSATIAAGQTTATLTVQTTADMDVEGDETFKVTITGTTLPRGVFLGTATAVGTIRDDDNAVSVGAASATEGSALSFPVRLSRAVSSDVVLGWSTGDDDTEGANQATAGTDYTAVARGSVTIEAGETTATLTVQTTDDTTGEHDETLKVTIIEDTLPAGVTIGTATAVGAIENDDGNWAVIEGGSATEDDPVTFTVRLSAPAPAGGFAARFATGDDDTEGANQATSGTDYRASEPNAGIFLREGQTTYTFSIGTHDDSDVEGNETFKVTLSNPMPSTGWSIATATAVGTIVDDDNAVSVGAASATEGSALSFTVRLPQAVSSDVVLGWSTGDDDTGGANQATAGTDYTAVTSGSATITAGQTTATFTVQTTVDAAVETDETFKVTITGTTLPAGVTIGTATAVGTIVDDDNAVSVGAASATEGSALSFTVRLPQAVSSDVVLGWSTGDDDTEGANQATAGTDYTAVTSGSATITAGQTTATFTVQTTADAAVETNETFKVTITGTTLPAGVTIGTATAVGTILDDDAVQVSVEAASATEGSALSFTVRLSEAVSSDVVLGWSTGDDDTEDANQATAGTDYTAVTSGSATITAGQTTATFTVQTTADAAVETDETFKVTITGTTLPAEVIIATATAVGTILDDDAVQVSVEAASATEGSALSFPVRLSEAVSSDVVLGWSTGDDDTSGANRATAGTDYTPVTSGSATIAAGQTTATLTVPTTVDTATEGSETFKVTITGTTLPAGVIIGTATAVGTIVDASATVSVGAASATEGSALSFPVRLSPAVGVSSDVVLGWSTGDDDTSGANRATAGTDYTAVTSGSVTIEAGETTATLTVQTTADTTPEPDETLKVTITGTALPAGVVIGTATAVGTIENDDGNGVSIEGGSNTEGDPVRFTVRLTAPAPLGNLAVSYSTGDDDTSGANSATAGTDYRAASGGFVVPEGETSRTFAIGTIDDSDAEGDETFKLTISNPLPSTGWSIATATAVGTILDDDAVTVSVEADAANEGSALSFPVRLSQAVGSDVVLAWSTGDDDTAGANQATAGTDYTVAGGSVTIAAGQTTATLTVPTTVDTATEGSETLKVVIAGTTLPAGVVIQTATAVGTIVDDGAVTVSVGAASATEGSALSFPVRLSQAAISDVVLAWSTGTDRTLGAKRASSGTDYTAVTSGSVTIAAGRTTATLTVPTTADTTAETDETLKVTITGTTLPAGVVIQTATAVGTIVDDDAVKVSVEADSMTEGTGSHWFRVELSKAASADMVLTWVTGDDDTAGANQATAGTDYERIRGGRTTISAGSTWVNLVVDTYKDNLLEGDETYKVTITGVSLPAGVVIQTATAVGTIKDNTLAVSLEQANQSAIESTGYSDMIVRLSRETYDSEVVVSLATSADDTEGAHQATAGTDYTAVTNGRVTIRKGQTRGDYRVAITNDSLPEETETFKVTMTAVTLPADAAIANATTIANIHDDDSLELLVQSASAPEGSRVEFTAELTAALDVDVSFWMYTVEDFRTGSRPATENTDFEQLRAILTIPAGKTRSKVFPVRTAVDNDVEGDETFLVVVRERRGEHALPEGIGLPSHASVGTILDAEATVSVGAASATEGSALSFPVRLSKAVSSNVVLGWSTGDTSGGEPATPGTDYTAVTGGSVTIAAGATTATLTVQTTDDSAWEGDETFQVTITGTTLPARVFIATATAVGTIEDDDAAAVSIGDASATEGSPVSFPVRLSKAASSAVVLGWSTGDTSVGRPATAGTDYTAVTDGSVTIATGETTATLTVQTTDDSAAEGDETFQVTITGTTLPADAFIRTGTAVGTILDDDGPPPPPPSPPGQNRPPVVSASCEPCVVAPGGELTLTATASDPDDDGLTYAWSATSGSFVGAADGATVRWTAPEAVERVTISVEVSDGQGGTASATVTIEVTNELPNEPPAFESSEYGFELREKADGSRTPVDVGAVAATDPEGDELIYEVASGDRSRFTVGARDGAVRYVGAGEDFESGPTRFELAVRARDPHGAGVEALVVVTVIDVNEPPQAVDDEAATDEDQAATIDVLANDTDPDGDGLLVESVSVPAHGTAAVARGGVLYTPEADYHGMDRFTYVVSDGNGEMSEAAVVVTVVPVNDAPAIVGAIPDQVLDVGDEAATLELGPYFEDVDGDPLVFRASSSDPSVATAMVSGTVLTLAPLAYGSATVTVTAEDPGGLTAGQPFSVGVRDPVARAAVAHTLAGMARSHLASARMMLGRRVTARPAETSRVMVLGRAVPLGKTAARTQAEQMLAAWLSAVLPHGGLGGVPGFGARAGHGFGGSVIGSAAAHGLPVPGGGFGAPALGVGSGFGARGPGAAPAGMMPAATTGVGGLGAAGHGGISGGFGSFGGFGGGSDPLGGSEFLLALGGAQDEDEASPPGRLWQVWGQGDVQTFRGAPSAAIGYDGQLGTAYFGVDTRLTDRWMAGGAVARSAGDGDWRAGGSRGSLETTLTAVHPYVQWSDGTTSVWATAGGGWGEAEGQAASGRREESGLGLRLGLVELRRRLGSASGVQFGVRGDAAWAALRTAAGWENIDDQTVAVNQARVGADFSRPVRLGGLTLAPFTEVNVRRDGGAGQKGEGVEVAGGLRATAGRVRVDAQGRLLVVHSAEGYRERGVGLTLRVGNQDQEGLSLSVSPRWGDSAAGGEALWREQIYRGYAPAAADAWGMDARGGYGLRLPGGRLLTWFGSLTHSQTGRGFLIGGQIGSPGPRAPAALAAPGAVGR